MQLWYHLLCDAQSAVKQRNDLFTSKYTLNLTKDVLDVMNNVTTSILLNINVGVWKYY